MTLEPPEPACFWLTLLWTRRKACSVCDAVMDTLKKLSAARFSTLPTLCWTDREILTSPRITSKLSCLDTTLLYFPVSSFNREREHCLLLPRNDPSTVSAHFFQTFQVEGVVAALCRARLALDYILLLAGAEGWCCEWCHGPSARGPGLYSVWQDRLHPAGEPFGQIWSRTNCTEYGRCFRKMLLRKVKLKIRLVTCRINILRVSNVAHKDLQTWSVFLSRNRLIWNKSAMAKKNLLSDLPFIPLL